MIFLTYFPAFFAGFQRNGSLLGRLITIVGCGGDLMSKMQFLVLKVDNGALVEASDIVVNAPCEFLQVFVCQLRRVSVRFL